MSYYTHHFDPKHGWHNQVHFRDDELPKFQWEHPRRTYKSIIVFTVKKSIYSDIDQMTDEQRVDLFSQYIRNYTYRRGQTTFYKVIQVPLQYEDIIFWDNEDDLNTYLKTQILTVTEILRRFEANDI